MKTTKIMAYGPITLWQIEEEKSGSSDRFYFLGCKITGDGDYSHEIKRCFLLGRKAMTKLDSASKIGDISLPGKVHIIKAAIFLVVICR